MTPRLTAFIHAAGPVTLSDQDIGQTIRDAVNEAKQEAMQDAREAQQEVRDAQQQLRDARTADQRGAANQAMMGAQQALREAERALREASRQSKSAPPFVYTSQPPNDSRPMIPGEAVDIAIGFFVTCAVIIVGWPISRALGRRFERRGAPAAIEVGVTDQLQRIEQAVEAIAIEVERISESQRFLARLQEKSASTLE